MIAIDPPLCPGGAENVDTPSTAAPTLICAELLLLSSKTLAFLLSEFRWIVTFTSRCQAWTVPKRTRVEYHMEQEIRCPRAIFTFAAPDGYKRRIRI